MVSSCYGELGCLNTSGFYDAKLRYVNAVPWRRDMIQTKFVLFTPSNPKHHDTIRWNSSVEEIRGTHFNPDLETKMFCHGFLQLVKMPDYPSKVGEISGQIQD